MTLESEIRTIKADVSSTKDRASDASFRSLLAGMLGVFLLVETCHVRKEVKDLRMLLASEKKVEDVYGGPESEVYFARPDGLRTYIMIDGTSIGTYKKKHEGFDVKQLPYAAQ